MTMFWEKYLGQRFGNDDELYILVLMVYYNMFGAIISFVYQ